jgi:hypothetical protein
LDHIPQALTDLPQNSQQEGFLRGRRALLTMETQPIPR